MRGFLTFLGLAFVGFCVVAAYAPEWLVHVGPAIEWYINSWKWIWSIGGPDHPGVAIRVSKDWGDIMFSVILTLLYLYAHSVVLGLFFGNEYTAEDQVYNSTMPNGRAFGQFLVDLDRNINLK